MIESDNIMKDKKLEKDDLKDTDIVSTKGDEKDTGSESLDEKTKIDNSKELGVQVLKCKSCDSSLDITKKDENNNVICPFCNSVNHIYEKNDLHNVKKEKDTKEKPENKEKDEKGKKEPINWKKEIISWSIIVAVAFLLALFITEFVIMKTEIISGSMIPELQIGDKVIGNRLAYLFSDPERGDVIFFEYPKSDKMLYEIDPELTYRYDKSKKKKTYHDNSDVYVKRVIGLPGDKVELKDGKVYINDSEIPLDEPYLNENPFDEDFGPVTVPEDAYFCLGDNRNISADARSWDNPINPEEDPDRFRFVYKKYIYAKAVLNWSEFKWVDHYRYNQGV